MKPTLIALLSASLILTACADPYGRSSQDPLGRVAVLDKLLSGELTKSETKLGPKPASRGPVKAEAIRSGTRYTYTDATRAGTLHAVHVYTDKSGKVVGVGGEFASHTREFQYGSHRVEKFVAEYWVKAAGSKPVLESDDGANMLGKERWKATFENGGLTGIWFKHVLQGERRGHDRVLDEVMIGIK